MAAGAAAGSQGGVRGFAPHDPEAPASHQRVLPLPSVTFDVATGAHSMDHREVHNYVRKMFYPASHGVLFADLPGLLKSIISALEQSTPAVAAQEPGGAGAESGRQPGVARPGTCRNC
jgi:hypothetical protein